MNTNIYLFLDINTQFKINTMFQVVRLLFFCSDVLRWSFVPIIVQLTSCELWILGVEEKRRL